MPYIELHARSAFSFLEGASLPEDMAGRCAELDLPAMALLDRDGVFGAVRFHLEARKRGVRALIGAEVTAAEGFRYVLLVEGRKARLYVHGAEQPCLIVNDLKLEPREGGVALWVGPGTEGYFANLKIVAK